MAMDEAVLAAKPELTTAASKADVEISIDTKFREFTPLYKTFDIDQSDKADKALSDIWEYCKKQAINKDDKDEIMLQVIRLNHQLGGGSIMEAPYAKLHRYVKVYQGFEERGKLLDELKTGKA